MSDRALQSVQDTLRLPLYQTEPQRSVAGFELINSQIFQNLIPQFHMDNSNQSKEQSLQKRPGIDAISTDWLTGKVNSILECTVMDVIAISAVYDVYVAAVFDNSNGTVYVIMFRPNAGTVTLMGSFAPSGASKDDYCFLTEFTQAVAGSSTPAVALSWTRQDLTVSRGYYAVTSAGVFGAASLTEITSTGFPPKQTPALISIGKFVWLNGVMFIASLDGRIWNSTTNGNDITTWSNGVVAIQAYPDQCVGLERYKHHIVAFGRNSIEFFNDVGNTPGPLESTQQAFIKFGSRSPRLTKNINDILYWISYGQDGVNGLWMLDGYTPVKLSNPFFDGCLSGDFQATDPQEFNMQAANIGGKPTLIINGLVDTNLTPAMNTFPTFMTTFPTGTEGGTDDYPLAATDFGASILCYNIEDKTWWAMQVQNDYTVGLRVAGTTFPLPSSSDFYRQILLYAPYNLDGSRWGQQYLYKWAALGAADEVADSSASQYPETAVTAVAQTNILWFGNEKRKRVNKAKIIVDQDKTSETDTLSLYLIYARDYLNWNGSTLDGPITRGVPYPSAVSRNYMSNLGSGRAWMFCIIDKSKTCGLFRALELDIQQNSH